MARGGRDYLKRRPTERIVGRLASLFIFGFRLAFCRLHPRSSVRTSSGLDSASSVLAVSVLAGDQPREGSGPSVESAEQAMYSRSCSIQIWKTSDDWPSPLLVCTLGVTHTNQRSKLRFSATRSEQDTLGTCLASFMIIIIIIIIFILTLHPS